MSKFKDFWKAQVNGVDEKDETEKAEAKKDKECDCEGENCTCDSK